MAKNKAKAEKTNYQLQIEVKLLHSAIEKAKAEDLFLSQVIRRYLIDYVNNPQGKLFN